MESTHDAWVRDDWHNAEALGIPGDIFQKISSLEPTSIDEIRLLALKTGLVRIREYKSRRNQDVHIQFWAAAARVGAVLEAVAEALAELGIHGDTRLVIDNLHLGDSRVVTLTTLQAEAHGT